MNRMDSLRNHPAPLECSGEFASSGESKVFRPSILVRRGFTVESLDLSQVSKVTERFFSTITPQTPIIKLGEYNALDVP